MLDPHADVPAEGYRVLHEQSIGRRPVKIGVRHMGRVAVGGLRKQSMVEIPAAIIKILGPRSINCRALVVIHVNPLVPLQVAAVRGAHHGFHHSHEMPRSDRVQHQNIRPVGSRRFAAKLRLEGPHIRE